MVNPFRTRYRVIRDDFLGFEAQFRYWWLPFWWELEGSNTSSTVERAVKRIEKHKAFVVWED